MTKPAPNQTMSNITSDVCVKPSELTDYLLFMVYCFEGIIMFVGNLLLLLPVLKHKAMRIKKEYIIVAGLALADCINGFCYIHAAIRRINLLLRGAHNDVMSKWQCAWVPSNFLWIFNEVTTGTMLMAISLDRLLLVLFPIWYIAQTYMYALVLVAVVYSFSFLVGGVGLYRVWGIRDRVSTFKTALCYFSYSTEQYHNMVHVSLLSYAGLTSVIMFCLVVVLYKKRAVKISTRISAAQAKRQRQMTISLGISSLFTLILFVIPMQLVNIVTHFTQLPTTVSFVCYILVNANCIMNLMIFMKRHAEVRRGLVAVFKCETLPVDINKWMVVAKHIAAVNKATKVAAAE